MGNIIEMRDVCYRYRDAEALAGISLEIREGESVALIGPNGSGKSTLLMMINGIALPSSGAYFFNGQKIDEAALKAPAFAKGFHKRVGLVFQNSDAQLFCPSVYEEIAFGPRQMLLPEDEVDRRVDDCLRLLGIGHLRHREPYHISEGEKRKTAIAAVLALNPDVITLDEPMDGLDPRTKRFLRGLLIDLNRSGKTIICATHEFNYIEGVFQKAAVVSEGHSLARFGPFDEVLADRPFLEKHNLV